MQISTWKFVLRQCHFTDASHFPRQTPSHRNFVCDMRVWTICCCWSDKNIICRSDLSLSILSTILFRTDAISKSGRGQIRRIEQQYQKFDWLLLFVEKSCFLWWRVIWKKEGLGRKYFWKCGINFFVTEPFGWINYFVLFWFRLTVSSKQDRVESQIIKIMWILMKAFLQLNDKKNQ